MNRQSFIFREEDNDGFDREMKEIKLFNESFMPVIANNYVWDASRGKAKIVSHS